MTSFDQLRNTPLYPQTIQSTSPKKKKKKKKKEALAFKPSFHQIPLFLYYRFPLRKPGVHESSNERFDMLIIDQGLMVVDWLSVVRLSVQTIQMRYICVHISRPSRISMGVFQKEKRRGERGGREGERGRRKAKGRQGWIKLGEWRSDAARRHLVPRRENRLSLFLHPPCNPRLLFPCKGDR